MNNLEKLSAYYKFTHDEDEFIISDVYERIKEKQEVSKQGIVKVMKMNNEIKKIIDFNDKDIEKTKQAEVKKKRDKRLKELNESLKQKKEKEPVKETEQPEMQLELYTPPPEPEEPEEEPEEVPVTH